MQQFMNLKMTRLEFIQFLGIAVVSIFGISNLLAFLSRLGRQKSGMTLGDPSRHGGFGSRPFGQ